jgi:hypothetical protein
MNNKNTNIYSMQYDKYYIEWYKYYKKHLKKLYKLIKIDLDYNIFCKFMYDTTKKRICLQTGLKKPVLI